MRDRQEDILKSLRSSKGVLVEPGYGSRGESLVSVAIELAARAAENCTGYNEHKTEVGASS